MPVRRTSNTDAPAGGRFVACHVMPSLEDAVPTVVQWLPSVVSSTVTKLMSGASPLRVQVIVDWSALTVTDWVVGEGAANRASWEREMPPAVVNAPPMTTLPSGRTEIA